MTHSQRSVPRQVHHRRGLRRARQISGARADARAAENTPAHRWLRPARALWLALVVPAYALWLAQLPAYIWALRHPTVGAAPDIAIQLGLADLQRLHAWGLSLAVYAGVLIALTLLFQLTYAAVGLLLFWRRAYDRMAFFASFALMMLPFAFAPLTLGMLPPAWRWIIPVIAVLGNGSLILCGYLFPDGRFAPRWIRALALLLLLYCVVAATLPEAQLNRSDASLLVLLGFALSVLPVQIYRYRAVSTPYQRQQTKWVVLGIVVGVIGNIAARTLHVVILIPLWGASALAFGAQVALVMLAMLAIPLAVGVAIFSSHLWDIDLVIHRTVLYSSLSALLAGIYAATVVILQTLIHPFTGLQRPGPLVITISTLLVAAGANPLRRWLQDVIDRRFYRRKYQRERVLTAYAHTLLGETELSQLRQGLLTVVDETMQPTHLSLWLSPGVEDTPARRGDREPAAGEPSDAA